MSPDYQKILALPHWHVPALRPYVEALAQTRPITFNDAERVLAGFMRSLKINELDLEMAQPEASVRAPFAADAGGGMDGSQAQIAAHVHRLLNGGGR